MTLRQGRTRIGDTYVHLTNDHTVRKTLGSNVLSSHHSLRPAVKYVIGDAFFLFPFSKGPARIIVLALMSRLMHLPVLRGCR